MEIKFGRTKIYNYLRELTYVFFIGMISVGLAGLLLVVLNKENEPKKETAHIVEVEKKHPGKIVMHDFGNGSKKEVAADRYPRAEQFVYFKNREIVDFESEATEIIPVVEIEALPKNKKGEIVPFENANTITLKYYGANHRFLREREFPKYDK